MTDLTVSIVNYNSRADLIGCLDSLKGLSPQGTVPEVWVVDNASAESIHGLEEEYKWAHFVFNEKNIGFGAANNIALGKARSKYFLVCNPDIRFRKAEFRQGGSTIEALAGFMDANKDVGIAGPKLVNADGTLQYSCRRFPTVATFLARGLFPGKTPKPIHDYLMVDADHTKTMDVDWVLGSFMFARKALLDKLGGFDERHFMYYEDIDLCYRVKKAGSRVVYVPQAEAAHTYKRESAGGLFNILKYYHTASAMRFFARYLGERKWRTFV
ncbi:MAG: glycosyltransferase family 2 protein [Candidatus Omnitrophica bacterium]|nr:glycosyltransferase family 2 protein [Candidatus Omnitrophota bacterium]MDD5546117.1 glycosyltransferase family 2 protein [Candidatus Omnitrophota bacterium]